jgi:hypothetical protein
MLYKIRNFRELETFKEGRKEQWNYVCFILHEISYVFLEHEINRTLNK